MKKLAFKLLAFMALLFISTFILQKFIDKGLKNDSSDEYKEWNDIFLSRINADILFQGASRARDHFSPHIFDSAFSMNSYNLGISGYGFNMQYYRFLIYLKYNKSPKYIIQCIDEGSLGKRKDLFEYSQFLPYLNDSIIKEAIKGSEGLNWRDQYIPLYKYRSVYDRAFAGLIANFRKPPYNTMRYKGYFPQTGSSDTAFKSLKKRYPNGFRNQVNRTTLDLLTKFMDLCKAKGITVIFVDVPKYYPAQKMVINRDSIINIIKNYASNYHIPYLDYSNDSICRDKANFYDYDHLNILGVKKFDIEIINDLKNIIKH